MGTINPYCLRSKPRAPGELKESQIEGWMDRPEIRFGQAQNIHGRHPGDWNPG